MIPTISLSTNEEFDQVIQHCFDLFSKKAMDYGTAWRILRISSLTDQIFIKAQRIRTIQMNGVAKIDEDISSELIGIVNYSIMALIQLEKGIDERGSSTAIEEIFESYNHYATQAKELMQNKNHDYGEAWRHMRISSLVDIILMKLLRIKQIEDNQGKTLVSEGLDANYYDIVNYAVFALIRLQIFRH
jgi:hypothetical protein